MNIRRNCWLGLESNGRCLYQKTPLIHATPAATKSSSTHALSTKEAMPKGIPPKNRCGAEGSKAGVPPLVFGGEGRRP
eukprot:3681211-Ditylum_brightwellii.AAC.1